METIVVPIQQDVDVFVARVHSRALAGRIGFNRRSIEELALVTTELALNIVKYSSRGELSMKSVELAEKGPAFWLSARDAGPPIRDFQLAMLDGFDDSGPLLPGVRRRGTGSGLGCVQRLTDVLEHRVESNGNVISVTRYLLARRRPFL